MKILITGGAGFIGSATIRYIINNTNDSVINVDSLTYAGNSSNVEKESKSNRYVFEKVDICKKDKLKKVFDEYMPDVVMHLAAESHVDRSISMPSDFINTNIIGTYNLLEVSRDYWNDLPVRSKDKFRFHHISTDEVYGDLPHPSDSMDAGKILFTETTSYQPSSPYSASKASSDHLVRAWARTYGLPAIVTNCSNNYGPYQFPEKLIPLTILNAINDAPILIYGVGDQIRDWLFVDDHARALYLVITKGLVGETYNIGGHNEIQNIDVVNALCEALSEYSPLKKDYKQLIKHISDRPGHDRRYAIDSNKIKKELGWVPKESFESGIHKTVYWYLNNLDWCEHVVKANTI